VNDVVLLYPGKRRCVEEAETQKAQGAHRQAYAKTRIKPKPADLRYPSVASVHLIDVHLRAFSIWGFRLHPILLMPIAESTCGRNSLSNVNIQPVISAASLGMSPQ
jgi:hypothetical protein